MWAFLDGTRCWNLLAVLLVISLTAHCGFINCFLRVCHYRPWILPTGGLCPC
ncbi:hypothetical protein L210DRAFT_857773 [Boletus edulis BED1]|uniref:Uncharacterized protein n=1 Tax=Boletus edulis BED1 TaxID=1328754 RepID=A0AAD4BQ02_BOLED|nr:hypothetical protein L210DRAFT_857773 [Boletus edulis BED1]